MILSTIPDACDAAAARFLAGRTGILLRCSASKLRVGDNACKTDVTTAEFSNPVKYEKSSLLSKKTADPATSKINPSGKYLTAKDPVDIFDQLTL